MTGNIQNIIVIESLGKQDGINFTGEALFNDFIKNRILVYGREVYHSFYRVKNKSEFLAILKSYIGNAPYMPGGIIIHLEMHGSEDLKGLVLSDGSLVEWEELVDLFREINIISCDNLFITMGTCYGRFLYKGVNPRKKSPYSGYISASVEVIAEEVYTKFGKLFEELIANGDIVDAYLEMEKTESNFYYKDSERTFTETMEITMQQLSNDKNLREQILSESINQIKDEIGAEISKEEADVLMKIAFKSIYDEHKQAFDFSDCK